MSATSSLSRGTKAPRYQAFFCLPVPDGSSDNDGSTLGGPSVVWSAAENVEVTAAAYLFMGGRETEFGHKVCLTVGDSALILDCPPGASV